MKTGEHGGDWSKLEWACLTSKHMIQFFSFKHSVNETTHLGKKYSFMGCQFSKLVRWRWLWLQGASGPANRAQG